MALFVAGAAFGIVGIARDQELPVYIGIVLLAVAFLLRFFRREEKSEE
jgi:hypothetical protein